MLQKEGFPALNADHLLFKHATDGMLICNERGFIEMANPAAEKMLGYGTGELVAMQIELLLPEDLRALHLRHRENFISKPVHRPMGVGIELSALCKDGKVIPVEISLSPYNYEGKTFVIAFVSDISVRKRADDKAKRSEQNLRLLIEHTPAAVAMFDTQMRYIIASRRWLSDYQLKEVDIIGKGHYEIFNDIPERWKELHRRCIAGETFRCDEDTFPRADGRLDWVKWELCPWYEQDGKVGGAILFTEVITRRKEAEEALHRLNSALEEKVEEKTKELRQAVEHERNLNEMKSRFVSMASHEFRTPLATVLSSVSLIEQYPLSDQQENRKKHIRRIKSAVSNLTTILDDFLSLDKLEQGKITTEASVFDLADLLWSIIEELQASLKEGQQINYTHRGGRQVCLDKQKLRNIVINLLSNAIKYSESPIGLDAEVTDMEVHLVFSDKGIGIPGPEQAMLFERFFRAKNAGNIRGTGLGLNIVKRYIDLMEGSITFSSALNEDTTFNVCLPLKEMGGNTFQEN